MANQIRSIFLCLFVILPVAVCEPVHAESFTEPGSSESLLDSEACALSLTQKLFSTKPEVSDPLQFSEELEKNLEDLSNEIVVQMGSDLRRSAEYQQLLDYTNQQMNHLSQVQDSLLREEHVSGSILKRFEQEINNISEQLRTVSKNGFSNPEKTESEPADKKDKWAELIDDPTLAEAETPYKVQMESGDFYEVILAENLVKQVFQDIQLQKVISRSLKRIQKGVFGSNYRGDGIIKLVANPSVFEVRANGKDGNFRFFGYQDKGELYLVHYTQSSNHSGPTTNKEANKVIDIKNKRAKDKKKSKS